MFFAGGPGRPIELGESIQEAIANGSTPRRVRIGFAYATRRGIPSLCEDDSGSDWRDEASSEWLIGIDQGITEPDALRKLVAHRDADVRVLIPGGSLSRDALYKRPRFHAKVALVESTSANDEASLITTSANLTASALDDLPTNYEIGMMQSTNSGLTSDDLDEFSEWWESAWSKGTPITDGFLDEYERIREDFIDDNPEIRQFESSTTVTHASEAAHLWIETREMTGGSGNQIELSEDLSPFIDTQYDSVVIEFDGDTYSNRPVTPRVTDPPFGVDITLVYLPTGQDYKNKFILLERLSSTPSEKPKYELTVANPGDDIVEEWRDRSRNNGFVHQTGGGRQYGYF